MLFGGQIVTETLRYEKKSPAEEEGEALLQRRSTRGILKKSSQCTSN